MPAPPLGSEPAIVSAVLIRGTDHRISDANDPWLDNFHEHSTTVHELLLQSWSHAIHLDAGFARNRDGHARGAEPEFFAFPQRHDVEPVDHDIFIKLAG